MKNYDDPKPWFQKKPRGTIFRGVLIFFFTAMISAVTVYQLVQHLGYREVYLPACSTSKPIVFSSLIAASKLDAFVWGYGKEPVYLSIFQGKERVERLMLEPDDDDYISWSYHGEWYDDFIVEISGERCAMFVTARL